jgi:hypothetical protein
VDLGLVIAQVNHGPGGGMAIVHLALVGIIVLGGLAFLLVRGARKGSKKDPRSDREPEG